jgi:hypothetical protein
MKSMMVPQSLLLLLFSATLPLATSFQAGVKVSNTASLFWKSTTSSTSLSAASYDQVAAIGYGVSVAKPLSVIFGENPNPYFGLVVDDVSEGMNGGRAGLRVGDQLLSVNGQVVVGKDFDSVMGLFSQSSGNNMELLLYRGPVTAVYTILSNQLEDDESVRDNDDDYDENDSEAVIMDENYESPVQIEVKEVKPLTPGDFLKAFKKVGSMLLTDDDSTGGPNDEPKQKKKGGGGFFGLGGESIQLDGDDAGTLK